MRPKFWLVMPLSDPPRMTRLKRLKISQRNRLESLRQCNDADLAPLRDRFIGLHQVKAGEVERTTALSTSPAQGFQGS